MKIAIACDHGGLEYKNAIKEHLLSLKHDVRDCGTDSKESCHYPIFAKKACTLLANKEVERVILVCTSGEGVMMVANHFKGIRCGIGYNDDVARLMREHNNANAIAFGQGFMKLEDVLRRVDIFLNTEFLGGRHQTRVDMIE